MPRVGFDAMLLWGRYSGVERAISHLARALHRHDDRHEFVLYTSAGCEEQWQDRPGWRVRRTSWSSRQRLRRIFFEQLRLPDRVAADQVDLLHAPGYVAPLRCRVPVVLTLYDLIALTHPRLCRPENVLHYRLLVPPSVRRARRVIAPSRHVADQLMSVLHCPHEKIVLCPLAVDDAFLTPIETTERERVQRRLNLPERYLLFVGNLEAKKNLPLLVRAFAAMEHEASLVLAGRDRGLQTALQLLAEELGVADRVQFLDYVQQSHLPALYAGAQALAFPSLVEGFGLPPLEAMACGAPAIVADQAAIRETVGQAAVRVDPADERAWAAALDRVFTDGALRQQLVAAGRRRVQDFTWTAVARRTAEVYDDVLS